MKEIKDPQQLFVHGLGEAITVEKTSLKLLEQGEKKASSDELRQLIQHHREETEGQLRNVEQAFEVLGERPKSQPCPGIKGIQEESQEMLKKVSGADELTDAALVEGAAKVEHYELAMYEALLTKAREMKQRDVAALLKENLEQEKHTAREVSTLGKTLAKQLTGQVA